MAKQSKDVVPDWSYFDAKEVSQLVRREADCLGSKWEFADLLVEQDKKWEKLVGDLQNWLLQEAELAVRRDLAEVKAGRLKWQDFHWSREENYHSLGDRVLCGYVARGPDHEFSDLIAKWIGEWTQDTLRDLPEEFLLGFDPLGPHSRKMLNGLGPWTAKYPRLKEFTEALQKRCDSPLRGPERPGAGGHTGQG